ncbi:MAG TPA: hypothetical protein PLG67_14595 [Bacillota bacterium]|nr:hypothetical protein [Bacillota bacterium]HQE67646.1 hypothetical protein [Bacillota bacterium]HQI17653.1 hypothetical protein [Bacillota bacterium]HQL37812.1 hypothetical protein [Bacillota bacterium]HRU42196.1 hypothetical protein [Candidatus Diapherotrites archaeon]
MKRFKCLFCFAMTIIMLITPVFAMNNPLLSATAVPQASAPIKLAIPAGIILNK